MATFANAFPSGNNNDLTEVLEQLDDVEATLVQLLAAVDPATIQAECEAAIIALGVDRAGSYKARAI